MRGLCITGTDTGVGKTVLAAALCAALRADGVEVAAFKPVVTGLDEQEPAGAERRAQRLDPAGPAGAEWRAQRLDAPRPPDHELLAAASGRPAAEVAPHTFGPPVSPHLAAALAGTSLDPAAIVATARRLRAEVVIAEGVGGLLVPLTLGYTVRDLAVDLGWPVVIAARPGLGTINHSLLTVEAARAAGLDVCAVVLTPWPERPGTMERSNREAIERLGGVEVATLGEVGVEVADLARAGATLPYERWLDRSAE
jgi:dethiobiotin synthetase